MDRKPDSHITHLLTELLKTSSKGEENGDGQNQPARQVPPQRAREVKGTNRASLSIEKPEGEGVVFQTACIERTQKRKHKQTAKGPPFVWTDAAEKAFGWIKKSFSGAGVLAHFDLRKRIHLETDASKFVIAAILSQFQEEGQWRPLAFWSRKLIPVETRYKTHNQELLAIVAAFKQWRHYLEGSTHTVEVLTDHNNLVAFQNVKSLNGRQARWAIALSGYDFTIAHQPDKRNPADAPSRRPDYAPSMDEVRRHRSYGTLQPLPVPEALWQEISMNFITDLLPSRNNKAVYDSILIIVDYFSKMSLYIPAVAIRASRYAQLGWGSGRYRLWQLPQAQASLYLVPSS